jgi:D-proline reductase (dithiol) PrdB
MPRLDTVPAAVRTKLLMRPVEVNHDSPWTPLRVPLASARVALVTSAGLHLRGDRPFERADPTFRQLPASVRHDQILQSHSSIGFDRSAIMQDVNVVFPIDRLRELADAHEIGDMAPTYYSFMGAQPDVSRIKDETSWQVAELLKADGVDLVVITPTCPFCTHTTGVIARNLEQTGLTTVTYSLVREHTEKLKPPRAVFVPFPFGSPLGRPSRVEEQLSVLRTGLGLTAAERGPVLLDFPEPADLDPGAGSPVQASTVPDRMEVADLALEVSATRGYWQQWYTQHGRTAVGLSGVDPLRFRGVVRYLEAYLAGEEPRRPVDSVASTPSFVRHCVEDVRAMYFEARLFTHPDESAAERQRWFWAQTEFGSFLRQLQRHMEQSDDEQTREAAYGIAR